MIPPDPLDLPLLPLAAATLLSRCSPRARLCCLIPYSTRRNIDFSRGDSEWFPAVLPWRPLPMWTLSLCVALVASFCCGVSTLMNCIFGRLLSYGAEASLLTSRTCFSPRLHTDSHPVVGFYARFYRALYLITPLYPNFSTYSRSLLSIQPT